MPPKKSPKRPPCQGNDIQYKRGYKRFCRSPSKSRAKSKSPPKPEKKSPPQPETKKMEFPVKGANRADCMRQYVMQSQIAVGKGNNADVVPVCEEKEY